MVSRLEANSLWGGIKDFISLAGGAQRGMGVSDKVMWTRGSACGLALSKCSQVMIIIVIISIIFAMPLVSKGQDKHSASPQI